MTDVFARLKGKKAQIGIVGMGYVGLPLALRFAEVGFAVTAFDVDPEKIEKLNARQSYLDHVSPEEEHPLAKNTADSP